MKKRKERSRSPATRTSPRKKIALEKERASKPQSSSTSPRNHKSTAGSGNSNKPELKQKGYTSDGMSFESLIDDDDDMLPDISLASPQKDKKYVRDDIVWAPWRNSKTGKIVYCPALVTSVKWPNVCFLYINEAKKHVYRTQYKRLLSFDNASRNLSLKEEGEKAYIEFLDAYEHAVKYLCKKRLDPQLNARRFLTLSDENDKIGQAKDYLFRLTGKLDSFQGEEEEDQIDDDDGVELFPDDENTCMEDNSQEEGNLVYEDEDQKKKKKFLKDLETLPSHMLVSSEDLDTLREEAINLLELIKTKECFDHLMNIRQGITRTSRHQKFSSNQEVLGCFGPFTIFDDLQGQLLTVLDEHCDEDEPQYKHNVMLPEAIIYAIGKLKNCEKLEAKKYFNRTSKKCGVKQ